MAGFQDGAFRFDLGTGTTAGGVASIPNPEGRTVVVTALILNITTPSSSASTLDAGIAANGTTSADNLIDGKSGAAAGVFTNGIDGGTNGKVQAVWGPTQHLTISQATGAVAGLVGEGIVEYITV